MWIWKQWQFKCFVEYFHKTVMLSMFVHVSDHNHEYSQKQSRHNDKEQLQTRITKQVAFPITSHHVDFHLLIKVNQTCLHHKLPVLVIYLVLFTWHNITQSFNKKAFLCSNGEERDSC